MSCWRLLHFVSDLDVSRATRVQGAGLAIASYLKDVAQRKNLAASASHETMLRALARPLLPQMRRQLSGAATAEATLGTAPPPPLPPAAVEAYSKATSALHWIMGGGMIACIATVQGAMRTKDNAQKGKLMGIHKSFGLLVASMVVPRVALALLAKRPGPVVGSAAWEHLVANVSHFALYLFMIVLPGTGIAMGYYGGKGLPFFGYNIPGAAVPNGAIAKNAFAVHKRAGLLLEYTVPLHVGGATMHALRGHTIFARINPFA